MHKQLGEISQRPIMNGGDADYVSLKAGKAGQNQSNIYIGLFFWLTIMAASVVYGWCFREHESVNTINMPRPLLVYVLCWGGMAFNAFIFRWVCRFWWLTLGGMMLLLLVTGCASLSPSSPEQIKAFCQAAEAVRHEDIATVTGGQAAGPYRLIAGDLLEVHLPSLMDGAGAAMVKTEAGATVMHLCRVNEAGVITLPLAGDIAAAGKTLKETETLIEQAVYPRYFLHRPTIVVTVRTYYSQKVTVVGAVQQSGVYELHHDEMTLVGAISRAGGLTPDGAAEIRIRRSAENSREDIMRAFCHDGKSIPTLMLRGGDIVDVDPAEMRRVTVLGLVRRPGVFSWRVDQMYNVMHALADAGGVDPIAAPEYVRISRILPDGRNLEAVVRMNDNDSSTLTSIALQTGDVVCVDQTPMTQVRLFLNNVLNIAAGVDLRTGYR